MSTNAFVVRAPLEFDDRDLVVATLRDYFALHLAAGQERCSDFDVGAFADHQHLVELDVVANRDVETFHAQTISGAGPVLFTACAKYSVHGDHS